MNHVTFRAEGMHCSGCAATIQALLEGNAGARVLYDPGAVSEAELVAMIEKAGYRVTERGS